MGQSARRRYNRISLLGLRGGALGAALLALFATPAAASPAGLGAAFLVYDLIFVAAPTMALYAWMIFFGGAALGLWVGGVRSSGRRVFAALALAPLALWTVSFGIAVIANQRHEAFRRAAEALPQLGQPPRTLIVHADGIQTIDPAAVAWRNNLVEMGAFDEVYATGPWEANWEAARTGTAQRRQRAQIDRPVLHRYVRSEKCRTQVLRDLDRPWWTIRAGAGFLACATAEPIDEVPQEGLHLFVGGEAPSRLSDDYPSYFGTFGPYELRLHNGGKDILVGYQEVPYSVWPMFPPAIALDRGFLRRVSIGDERPGGRHVTSFVLERLGLALDGVAPPAHPQEPEVEAEYRRLLHSPVAEERVLALMIGAALGPSLASRDDVRVVLDDKDIVARLVEWSRLSGGFCGKIGRLASFKEDFVAACRRDETERQREDSRCGRFEQRIGYCAEPEEREAGEPF